MLVLVRWKQTQDDAGRGGKDYVVYTGYYIKVPWAKSSSLVHSQAVMSNG